MPGSKIQPEFLRKGDVVTVISPSYRIDAEKLDKAVEYLGKWGLRVKLGKHSSKQDGPFAGSDNERLSDLQEAVNDPSVKAVICARGGYGASRIVDRVDFTPLRLHPKWFAGFSDITVLHMWLSEVCGMVSLHSDMPLNFGNPEKTGETFFSMKDALFGNLKPLEWEGRVYRPGLAEGEVTGGNLSLLYSLAGTPADPDTEGRILVIEETGEYYYHIDRMLTSMRLAGKLDRLAALVVGGMNDISDSRTPWGKTMEETIIDVVKDKSYPVMFGFPAGHVSDNRAFYIGKKAAITVSGSTVMLTYT